MTIRNIPSSVAAVLQELELEQHTVVTKKQLAKLTARAGVALAVSDVAERLQRHGWLLPLRTREAWEFAPAARAGPIGSGDPFVELRATLLRRPGFPVAVAYESAAWLHQLASRAPRRHALAVSPAESVPHALRDFRVTRMWAKVAAETINDVPVWGTETLVVLIGARPLAFRDWPNIGEWLAAAAEQLEPRLLLHELDGRPRSAWMRTGYLLETARRHELAEQIRDLAPLGSGPFYLGSRHESGRYDRRWEVHDSTLRYRRVASSDIAGLVEDASVERTEGPAQR